MENSVFISHADADKDIAAEFVRLLSSGLNITGSMVFCSSLPGRTIPGGFNFIEHIQSKLSTAKVVILLITDNYLASQFCLAEIGASWITKEGSTIPVIVPPLGFKKLKATLSITQAWKINDSDGLNSLVDDICRLLDIKYKAAQWGTESRNFLKNIQKLIDAQIGPVVISPEEYKEIKDELRYCEQKLVELKTENVQLKELIEKLKECKDSSEVRELVFANGNSLEKFDTFCTVIKDALKKIPSIVEEAIYYYKKEDSLPYPNRADNDKWDAIHEAADRKLLDYQDGEPISLNIEHPLIKRVLPLLDELEWFMRNDGSELNEWVTEEYGITFDISNKDFWNKFL